MNPIECNILRYFNTIIYYWKMAWKDFSLAIKIGEVVGLCVLLKQIQKTDTAPIKKQTLFHYNLK